MVNDDEIYVGYDRTDVPTPNENNIYGFSKKISNYLYPKIYSIQNEDNDGNIEFNNNEIQNHGIVMNNEGRIDISTTRKLLIYLKGLVRKSVDRIDNELNIANNRINENNRRITEINDEINDFEQSTTTKFNNVNTKLNNKSNITHTHQITEISTLNPKLNTINSSLNNKANSSDLSNHVNNKNNPHSVTLNQLGFVDTGWKNITPTTNFYLKSGYKFQYRSRGDIVHIRGGLFAKKDIGSAYNILGNIPKEYAPNFEEVVPVQGELNKYSLNLVIRTDGTIGLMNKSESKNLNILQNTWLPIYITYFLG